MLRGSLWAQHSKIPGIGPRSVSHVQGKYHRLYYCSSHNIRISHSKCMFFYSLLKGIYIEIACKQMHPWKQQKLPLLFYLAEYQYHLVSNHFCPSLPYIRQPLLSDSWSLEPVNGENQMKQNC